MGYQTIDHIATHVTELQQAEQYYCQLSDLDVVFREAATPTGWAELPHTATWDDARSAGINLQITLLARGAFRLAIDHVAEAINGVSRLSHACMLVDDPELVQLRQRVLELGHTLAVDRPTYVQFVDRYHIRWEATSKQPQSNGLGAGRWLDLGRGGS